MSEVLEYGGQRVKTSDLCSQDCQEVVSRIWNTTRLSPGWDGDEGEPTSVEAAQIAAEIVRLVLEEVAEKGLDWSRPQVSATGDGGVLVGWRVGLRRKNLIVNPKSDQPIVCVWWEDPEELAESSDRPSPRMEVRTMSMAVDQILTVLVSDDQSKNSEASARQVKEIADDILWVFMDNHAGGHQRPCVSNSIPAD